MSTFEYREEICVMIDEKLQKDVIVVGGGPAGMMLGLLLAKVGVQVIVLESHDNFDREYRGEVLQPRFIQLLNQLKLREYIEQLPHSKLKKGAFYHYDKKKGDFDFTSMIAEAPYALWIPQPILLQALYKKAKEYPTFDMMFHTPVKKLLQKDGTVTGVVVERENKELLEIQAKIVVGADGRFSTIRRLGGFELEYQHYPGDLIWFSVKRPSHWGEELRFKITEGHSYITLPKYPDLLQVGIALPRGEWKETQRQGIENFRQEIMHANKGFDEFAESLVDFKPFVPLQAKNHMVKTWAKNGCLLIGDAAHCSSPVGAIGVSLAVTTAVVAADVIWDALQKCDVSAKVLCRVQEIRSEEIEEIHQIQERMGNMFFTSSKFVRGIRPYIVSAAFKTPLFSMIQKKLFVMKNPIGINPAFIFNEE